VNVDVLPGRRHVRNLLEDLLGRDVSVGPGDPLTAADLPTATIAMYDDSSERLYGVLGMQLCLAAHVGAALGLLPAAVAADCIDERKLFPDLAENVFGLCNVLIGLLNTAGAPSVKLSQVVYPGMPLPDDARAHLLAPGRRLDVTIDVAGYGDGKLSLSLAA
jgi:hypothetical protein